MKTKHGGRRMLLLAGLLLPAVALGQPRVDPNPDATVEIEEVRVGVFVLGGSFGGGRLHFRGQQYPFSVSGLDLGSVGVSSISARGEVFGLTRVEDFAGKYTDESPPRPPGNEGGPEPLRLRNAAGVVLRLRSDRDGGQLRVAPAGLDVQFRNR